eukprot:m51a1_g3139 hypothetical protein (153) ;mRNA; f:302787-303245
MAGSPADLLGHLDALATPLENDAEAPQGALAAPCGCSAPQPSAPAEAEAHDDDGSATAQEGHEGQQPQSPDSCARSRSRKRPREPEARSGGGGRRAEWERRVELQAQAVRSCEEAVRRRRAKLDVATAALRKQSSAHEALREAARAAGSTGV